MIPADRRFSIEMGRPAETRPSMEGVKFHHGAGDVGNVQSYVGRPYRNIQSEYDQPETLKMSQSLSEDCQWSSREEPRVKVPEYNGKVTWKAFWMQFEMIADQYNWDEATKLERLFISLRGKALDYACQLQETTRLRLVMFVRAMDQRFGDHILPETYRATLNNVKKQKLESLREYEARVRKLVGKAYPGIEGTEIYNSIAIEHLVMGLPDSNMAFDIMSKHPKTIEEALHAIEWYESCKSTQKKRLQIRKVGFNDRASSDSEDENIESTSCDGSNLVTEEMLLKFGEELKKSVISEISAELNKRISKDTHHHIENTTNRGEHRKHHILQESENYASKDSNPPKKIKVQPRATSVNTTKSVN